jgi:hypothetical protein
MTLETHFHIYDEHERFRSRYGGCTIQMQGMGCLPSLPLIRRPREDDGRNEGGDDDARDISGSEHAVGSCPERIAAPCCDIFTALDAHCLEEILSRLSLQSLAKLSCASRDLSSKVRQTLLGSGVLVDFREDLATPYEPSMLQIPLQATHLPLIQRWDRYSVFHDLVSELYHDLARASNGGLVFQRSLS